MDITGGCLCRAVRYSSSAAPIVTRACWCRVCQYIGAGSAKRTQITDFYSIQNPNQARGETITKRLMPRQRPSRTPPVQAGTERDVRTPLDNWR